MGTPVKDAHTTVKFPAREVIMFMSELETGRLSGQVSSGEISNKINDNVLSKILDKTIRIGIGIRG